MPVSTIVHHWFGADIPIVFDDCRTKVLMNHFKTGRSHMALVKTVVSEDDADPYYKTVLPGIREWHCCSPQSRTGCFAPRSAPRRSMQFSNRLASSRSKTSLKKSSRHGPRLGRRAATAPELAFSALHSATTSSILAHTYLRQGVLLIWAQEEILDEKDVIAAAGELTRKEEKADVARQVAGGGALPFQHPLLQYLQAKERQEATLPAAELEAIASFLRVRARSVPFARKAREALSLARVPDPHPCSGQIRTPLRHADDVAAESHGADLRRDGAQDIPRRR